MKNFIIGISENGFHINDYPYWFNGRKIQGLYRTCHSYKECIEWLEENYPNDYVIKDIELRMSPVSGQDSIKINNWNRIEEFSRNNVKRISPLDYWNKILKIIEEGIRELNRYKILESNSNNK